MAKTHTIEKLDYEMEMVSDYVLSITTGFATGYVAVTGQSHGEPVYGFTTEEGDLINDDIYGHHTIANPIRKSSNLTEIIEECAKTLSPIDTARRQTMKSIKAGANQLRSWA